jgi:hypothetical protein
MGFDVKEITLTDQVILVYRLKWTGDNTVFV